VAERLTTRGPTGREDVVMPRTEAPIPLLFLISDTGGGHRNAARAVGQDLDRMHPGRFAPVLCDPLAGPGSARPLRWVTRLYGPAIRMTPWLWGAAYHVTNSRPAVALLRRTLLRLADRPARAAARASVPAAIVFVSPAHRHGRARGAGPGRAGGSRRDPRHRPGQNARGVAFTRTST
jgi:hypothetical protein